MATQSVIHDEASIPSADDYKRLRNELADAVSFIKSHSETLTQLGALFEAIKADRWLDQLEPRSRGVA